MSHTGDRLIKALKPHFVADPIERDHGHGGDYRLNPENYRPSAGADLKNAAVLVGIKTISGEDHFILNVRQSHLSNHAGQVAFPGGRSEQADGSPVDAALREAEEENGLFPDYVQTKGMLDVYATITGYRIVPVLARISEQASLVANPDEVSEIFSVPITFFMEPLNKRSLQFVHGNSVRHTFEFRYQHYRIWGVTAGIIAALLQRAERVSAGS